MAKYLVETYYTCTFKVNHYLDEINETELKNLEKRDDGKFEVIDVKLDNRKTKNLDPNKNKTKDNKIDLVTSNNDAKKEIIPNLIRRLILPFYIPVIALICSFLLIKSNILF